LVENSSCGRGPVGGLGLMVSRDEAEPARRMPGRGGGMTGRVGRGAGFGRSCSSVRFFGAAALTTAGLGVGFGVRLGALGAVRLTALAAGFAARARGVDSRARDGFFAGRLEELTPEFSDLADRAGGRFQSYDGRRRWDLAHPFRHCVWDALGVNPDHTVVNPALLDHERADGG